MRLTAMVMMAFCAAPMAGWAQSMPPASTAACAAMDANLPADLAGWSTTIPMAAATKASGLAKAILSTGRGVEASLPLTPEITFVTQPEKPGGTVSHGGLFGLNIDKAGTYVIALGSGAWIDLLSDGKALESSGHSHGPACSTIHKLVEFPLTPGRYVLQLSGGPDAKTGVLVAHRP